MSKRNFVMTTDLCHWGVGRGGGNTTSGNNILFLNGFFLNSYVHCLARGIYIAALLKGSLHLYIQV